MSKKPNDDLPEDQKPPKNPDAAHIREDDLTLAYSEEAYDPENEETMVAHPTENDATLVSQGTPLEDQETIVQSASPLEDQETIVQSASPLEDQETIVQSAEPDHTSDAATLVVPDGPPGEEMTIAPNTGKAVADADATVIAGKSGVASGPATQATKGGVNAREIAGAPTIDGYQITGKIGEGGMGVVWKANQLSTNRIVALKLLPPSSIGSGKAQQRFQREVETAAKLDHPYICSVYDSGINRGVYFYAMQAVDGEEMHDYLAEHNLDLRDKLKLMLKVCQALAFAHEHSVVHRDLKPGNILVTPEGDPSVLDFGLAKSVDRDSDLSIAGEVVGTPMYMSTEQARGNVTDIDGRTDVYSLGVMLFEQTTGAFPYDGSGGPYAIIQRKFEHQPFRPTQFNKELDLDLEAVILKAIATDRDHRHATCGELAEDIEHYLAGRPVSARRHTFGYVSYLWFKRNKYRLAAAVIIMSLLGGAYWFIQMQEAEKRAAAELGEKEALAKLATVGIDTARETLNKGYKDKLVLLQKAIGDRNSSAANLHLNDLKGLLTDPKMPEEVRNEVGTTFKEQFEASETLLTTLLNEEKDAAMLSANRSEQINQSLTDIKAIAVQSMDDITPGLAEQLAGIKSRYPADVLVEPNVKERVDSLGRGIDRTIKQALSRRDALEKREARLTAFAEIIQDPRLYVLFPEREASIQAALTEQRSLHLLRLENPRDLPILVTINDETTAIPEFSDAIFQYKKSSGATCSYAVALSLASDKTKPDPAYEVVKESFAFVSFGGEDERVSRFSKIQAVYVFPPDGDLDKGGVVSRQSLFEEDGYEPAGGKELRWDPGPHYVEFIRQDYETIRKYIPIKPDDLGVRVVLEHPGSTEWKAKAYLSMLADGVKALEAKDMNQLASLVTRIEPARIDSKRSRDLFLKLKDEAENNPLVKIAAWNKGALPQIDEYLASLTQRHDPSNASRFHLRGVLPFRHGNGDCPVPQMPVLALTATAMAALDAQSQMEYSYLNTWATVAKGVSQAKEKSGKEARELAVAELNRLLPSLSANPEFRKKVAAEVAVLGRPDAKATGLPPGALKTLDDPQLIRWYTHAVYRAGDWEESVQALEGFARFAEAGGQMNPHDVQLFGYALYFSLGNVIQTIRVSGIYPGHEGYAAEKSQTDSIFALAKRGVPAMKASAVRVSVEEMAVFSGEKKKMEQYMQILNLFRKLPMAPELKELAQSGLKGSPAMKWDGLEAVHKKKFDEVKSKSEVLNRMNAVNSVILDV